MMGPKQEAQGVLFHEFSIEDHVPQDHLLRSIDRCVDLSGIRQHLAPFYSNTGRPDDRLPVSTCPREEQMHAWADEIITLADDATGDFNIILDKKQGDVAQFDITHVRRAELQIKIRQWLMERILPAI